MAWPLNAILGLAAVALIAAAPFVVYEVIRYDVAPGVAPWISFAIGAVMLIGIASAWVLLRARRNARSDRAKGLEPT